MKMRQCATHFCPCLKDLIFTMDVKLKKKKILRGSLMEDEMQTDLCKFKHLPLNFGNGEVKSL